MNDYSEWTNEQIAERIARLEDEVRKEKAHKAEWKARCEDLQAQLNQSNIRVGKHFANLLNDKAVAISPEYRSLLTNYSLMTNELSKFQCSKRELADMGKAYMSIMCTLITFIQNDEQRCAFYRWARMQMAEYITPAQWDEYVVANDIYIPDGWRNATHKFEDCSAPKFPWQVVQGRLRQIETFDIEQTVTTPTFKRYGQ